VSREWAVLVRFDRMDWETPGFTDWLRDKMRRKLAASLEANGLTLAGEPAEHLRFMRVSEPFEYEVTEFGIWQKVDITLSARYRTAEEQREHWRQQFIANWRFGASVAAMQPPGYSSIVLHPSL
jgi:hypothetical protein